MFFENQCYQLCEWSDKLLKSRRVSTFKSQVQVDDLYFCEIRPR